jgi:hypothetical protein
MLAQSRSDMISAGCRVFTYLLAFLPAIGLTNSSTAASIMIPIQFTSLINNIFTQMFPIGESVWSALKIFVTVFFLRRTTEYRIGDVVYSLVERSEPTFPKPKQQQEEYSLWCLLSVFVKTLCPCIFAGSGSKKKKTAERISKDGLLKSKTSTSNSSLSDNDVKKEAAAATSSTSSSYSYEIEEDSSNPSVVVSDEGVIVGFATSKQFPKDYRQRLLVEFPNGLVLGLLMNSEVTRDYTRAEEEKQVVEVTTNSSTAAAGGVVESTSPLSSDMVEKEAAAADIQEEQEQAPATTVPVVEDALLKAPERSEDRYEEAVAATNNGTFVEVKS